tara:strand:+ start:190 stop:696 length:507 start_codon:yes stop_codon:yes gene_type:complete
MLVISHVVALSNNNVIGVDNDLPWNLKADLSHFKEYTTNKIIVMGRKTYQSIGRPLPNRINIVVSNTVNAIEGAIVSNSIDNAIESAKELCLEKSLDEIVIIGGGYLFRDTLPITNKLIITRVDCDIDGDVFYPEVDLQGWKKLETVEHLKNLDNDYDFEVSTYERIK